MKISTETSSSLASSAQTALPIGCIGSRARNGIFAARDHAPNRPDPVVRDQTPKTARDKGPSMRLFLAKSQRPPNSRSAWWTNRGQTGHWEIAVFPAFSKLKKPANDAPKGGVRQSARSRRQ